jgi:hypothetical protein
MNRYFTKTFFTFLVSFLLILGVAFGVMIFAAQSQQGSLPPASYAAGNTQ